jgi:hypothetical protein
MNESNNVYWLDNLRNHIRLCYDMDSAPMLDGFKGRFQNGLGKFQNHVQKEKSRLRAYVKPYQSADVTYIYLYCITSKLKCQGVCKMIELTLGLYNDFLCNTVKLSLIEKAVAEDKNRYDNFFDSSTVEKIRFVLDKRKQSESESVELCQEGK